jgi:transcriptional regulator of arginine metabolism
MKTKRQSAIRDLLVHTAIGSQDELRRKLAGRGFRVTQATLSRDIHELKLLKGPAGYALPDHGGNLASETDDFDDALPAVADLLATFGVEVRQAGNLLVLLTAKGAAQPVAAGIDDEEWSECLGTIAGDNTVLLICRDMPAALALRRRLEALLA